MLLTPIPDMLRCVVAERWAGCSTVSGLVPGLTREEVGSGLIVMVAIPSQAGSAGSSPASPSIIEEQMGPSFDQLDDWPIGVLKPLTGIVKGLRHITVAVEDWHHGYGGYWDHFNGKSYYSYCNGQIDQSELESLDPGVYSVAYQFNGDRGGRFFILVEDK